MSPFHFARVFRRATGLPPHSWLMQRRVERARALLKVGCTPLTVAMQLGFADQSHLTRQFKQTYGIGPGAYRKACATRPLYPGCNPGSSYSRIAVPGLHPGYRVAVGWMMPFSSTIAVGWMRCVRKIVQDDIPAPR